MELRPCPSRPICVSTRAERDDIDHYIRPVKIDDAAPDRVLNVVTDLLIATKRARVSARAGNRVEAVFVSRILRLRSDVIFIVDADDKLLHFRSASRFALFDMHSNRKRMEDLVPVIRRRLRETTPSGQREPKVVVFSPRPRHRENRRALLQAQHPRGQ